MTEPLEEYIRGIKGVKILINEDLNDDEIMVSPRVYEKMKSELKGKPVGYSPKHDEDFQKMLDELGEVNENYPAFDLTPPTLRCIPERTGTLKKSIPDNPITLALRLHAYQRKYSDKEFPRPLEREINIMMDVSEKSETDPVLRKRIIWFNNIIRKRLKK